jgi:nitroimidazol reductase NimA-like FMN-containing flavoprotein (pyridoxamine 5'-phosphate oxidase superfamily)
MSIGIRRWDGRYLEKGEIEKLLEEAKIARVCCHNEDGTIHATPTWFKYEDGIVKIPIMSNSRKARNIKRNKNVTILVDQVKPPRGAMIYGTAILDDTDVINKAIKVNEKYQSKEDAKATIEQYLKETDFILTVKPEHLVSFHY